MRQYTLGHLHRNQAFEISGVMFKREIVLKYFILYRCFQLTGSFCLKSRFFYQLLSCPKINFYPLARSHSDSANIPECAVVLSLEWKPHNEIGSQNTAVLLNDIGSGKR